MNAQLELLQKLKRKHKLICRLCERGFTRKQAIHFINKASAFQLSAILM